MTAPRQAVPTRVAEAGMTLVEVLVGLALFAVIGTAGFSVLDQTIRIQARTEGRLARLAEMQRTMHVLKLDLMQADAESLALAGGVASFRRSAGQGDISVRYALEDGVLVRVAADGSAGEGGEARQRLLSGVGAIGWGLLDAEGVWTDARTPAAEAAAPVGAALDLAMTGEGLSGDLRLVVALPADPDPDPDP